MVLSPRRTLLPVFLFPGSPGPVPAGNSSDLRAAPAQHTDLSRTSSSFLILSFNRHSSVACQALFSALGTQQGTKQPSGSSQAPGSIPKCPRLLPPSLHGGSHSPGFPQKHQSHRASPSLSWGSPEAAAHPLLCPQGGLAAELRVPNVLGAAPRRRPAACAATGQEGGERGPVLRREYCLSLPSAGFPVGRFINPSSASPTHGH